MRQQVADVFFDFSVGHEGFTPFMYCDILNLVTTGVGNLIDHGPNHGGASTAERARLNNVVSAAAMAPAMRLPWRLKAPGWTTKNPLAGALVSPAEVADAWTKVKRQNEVVPNFSQKGGFAYAGLTNLTLDMDAIRALFNTTRDNFEKTIRAKNPEWDSWPADAQLATLSMAWAMGPAFTDSFKTFKAAVDRKDFAEAAKQSFFRGGGSLDNPKSRNAENKAMFLTADKVQKEGGDFGRLFFQGSSSLPVMPSAGVANVSGKSPVNALAWGSGIAALGLLGWGGKRYYDARKVRK